MCHSYPGRRAGHPRESVPRPNACVRRAYGEVRPGLARSRTAQRNAVGETFCSFAFPAARRKPVICRRGKSRSPYTSIGLHYPVPPKPGATIELRSPCCAQAQGDLPWSPVERVRSTHGCPPNACVGPHVFHGLIVAWQANKKEGPRRALRGNAFVCEIQAPTRTSIAATLNKPRDYDRRECV